MDNHKERSIRSLDFTVEFAQTGETSVEDEEFGVGMAIGTV